MSTEYLISLGQKAKKASAELLTTDMAKINDALNLTAKLIRDEREFLKSQNKIDIDNAVANGKSDAFIDRLTLSDKVIDGVAEGIEQVAKLDSPLNKVTYTYENKEQGIVIEKKGVPFGVVGIIYESRPNVTADAFALCFKTANAVILKGGSDSINSNIAMVKVIRKALSLSGINQDAVAVIEDTNRETTIKFMRLNKYVDLIIPRGSASLIRSAVENSTIPIIETGTGNCHAFVDESANIDMASEIIYNAKTQRYSVCNALESIVVHSKIAKKALPKIAKKLAEKKVEIRADERAYDILRDYPYIAQATEDDFYTEYGSAIISVKTVDDLAQAIAHINECGTRHSETIITENLENAKTFMQGVDASSVYHNASTRFTDGFVFGLGAEIGISTQKLHARGPMGLDALLTQKYFIRGNGAVRK